MRLERCVISNFKSLRCRRRLASPAFVSTPAPPDSAIPTVGKRQKNYLDQPQDLPPKYNHGVRLPSFLPALPTCLQKKSNCRDASHLPPNHLCVSCPKRANRGAPLIFTSMASTFSTRDPAKTSPIRVVRIAPWNGGGPASSECQLRCPRKVPYHILPCGYHHTGTTTTNTSKSPHKLHATIRCSSRRTTGSTVSTAACQPCSPRVARNASMLALTSSRRSAVTATSALSASCSRDCKIFGGNKKLFSSGSSAEAPVSRCHVGDFGLARRRTRRRSGEDHKTQGGQSGCVGK